MDITPLQSICGWINLCLKFETFIDEFMSTIIVKSAGPQLFTSYFFFRSLAQCCPKLKCLCVLLCIPNIEEGERGYLTKGNSKAKTIKLEDLPNCVCGVLMEEVLNIILFGCDFAFQTSRHLASYISCPRIPSRASYRPTSTHEQSHLRAQSYPFPVYCSKQTQIPFWQLAKGLQPSHSDSSTKKKKEKNIHCFYHSCYVTLSDQAVFVTFHMMRH